MSIKIRCKEYNDRNITVPPLDKIITVDATINGRPFDCDRAWFVEHFMRRLSAYHIVVPMESEGKGYGDIVLWAETKIAKNRILSEVLAVLPYVAGQYGYKAGIPVKTIEINITTEYREDG